tara:strand:- start:1081 stop:1497 length:417 start_codon:yes stop_codon:yes gene_type:complete
MNYIINWLCKDKIRELEQREKHLIFNSHYGKDKLALLEKKCKELDEARQEFFGDDCYEDIPLSLLIDGLSQDSKNNTELEYEIEALEEKIEGLRESSRRYVKTTFKENEALKKYIEDLEAETDSERKTRKETFEEDWE